MAATAPTHTMKKLINGIDDIVPESLAGLAAAHPDIVKIDVANAVVLRAGGPKAGKVGLISGGGSGHEPLHGGFVGLGMLDAACAGEIFTSPVPMSISTVHAWVPPDHPLSLGEDLLRQAAHSKIDTNIADHSVVEPQERQVQLGDDEILVVAGVAGQCGQLTVAWHVVPLAAVDRHRVGPRDWLDEERGLAVVDGRVVEVR